MEALITLGTLMVLFAIVAMILAILYFRTRRELAAEVQEQEPVISTQVVFGFDGSRADAISRAAEKRVAVAEDAHSLTLDTLAELWRPEVDKNLEKKPVKTIGVRIWAQEYPRTRRDAVRDILASIRAGQAAIKSAAVESQHIATANRFRLAD